MNDTDRLCTLLLDNNASLAKWARNMIHDEAMRCELHEFPDGTRRLGIELDQRVCDRLQDVFNGYHDERRPFGRVIASAADPFYYQLHKSGGELVRDMGTLRHVDWTGLVNRLVDAVSEEPAAWWLKRQFTTQAESLSA